MSTLSDSVRLNTGTGPRCCVHSPVQVIREQEIELISVNLTDSPVITLYILYVIISVMCHCISNMYETLNSIKAALQQFNIAPQLEDLRER